MYKLSYGTVRESQRRAIFVVRVEGAILEPPEIEDLIERMRERLLSRGQPETDVVLMQGDTRATFRLHGHSYSVSRVRTALFNAAVSWTPLELGG